MVEEEAAPPSRLNANVPRDLNTICLKCLHKDPSRRYATAAELAEDLRRFQRGEPIRARPVGTLERLLKWAWRHPTLALALSGGLVLTVALASGGSWLVMQRSATAEAVENDVQAAGLATQHSAWGEARTALERAHIRLGAGGSSSLRRRVDQCERELEIVKRLDDIRLARVTRGELVFYKVQADRDYDQAFREIGIRRLDDDPVQAVAAINASPVQGVYPADFWANLIMGNAVLHAGPGEAMGYYRAALASRPQAAVGYVAVGDDAETVAKQIHESNIRQTLVDALDQWVLWSESTRANTTAIWVLAVARQADPDPGGWRNRFPDPSVRTSKAELSALADAVDFDQVPVNQLVALSELLDGRVGRAKALPFVRKVQERHPDDLWANFFLGHIAGNPADARQYYQAALAVRPATPFVHYNLGIA